MYQSHKSLRQSAREPAHRGIPVPEPQILGRPATEPACPHFIHRPPFVASRSWPPSQPSPTICDSGPTCSNYLWLCASLVRRVVTQVDRKRQTFGRGWPTTTIPQPILSQSLPKCSRLAAVGQVSQDTNSILCPATVRLKRRLSVASHAGLFAVSS
jgi:hypothetical protein